MGRAAETQSTPRMNKITNSKLEIRDSKQFQMVKKEKVPNKPVSDFVIGIQVFGFVSDFDIRISDFLLLASWRDIHC
jgi:hypothetical protein